MSLVDVSLSLCSRSTFNAFGEINRQTVFRMNDQPQPEKVKSCLEASLKKDMQGTFAPMHEIWQQGYSATDIISTFACHEHISCDPKPGESASRLTRRST